MHRIVDECEVDEAKEQRIEFLGAGEDAPEALQSPKQPSDRYDLGHGSARWRGPKVAKKPVFAINTATYWYAMRANGSTTSPRVSDRC